MRSLSAALLSAAGAAAAVGRLRAVDSLSPPDVVFYAQSAASAARGEGFAQTALRFDHGGLTTSVHLSPWRLAHALAHTTWDDPAAALALQGALLGPVFLLLRALIGGRGAGPTLGALALSLHPLCLSLLLCDLRPITTMLPGGLLLLLGLRSPRPRVGLALAGALLCALAREEALYVILAMAALPLSRIGRRPAAALAGALVCAVGAAGAAALPLLVWGRLDNIDTNANLAAELAAIAEGQRPLLRWPQATHFGLRALVGAPSALLHPAAWPAVGAWLFLAAFSALEPLAPGHGGLHYLSVCAPGLLGGAALALRGRLGRRGGALSLALALVIGLPEWPDHARWLWVGLGGADRRAAEGAALTAPVRAQPGPVVTDPRAAPLLSTLPVLHLQGHFSGDAQTVEAALAEARWVILPTGLRLPDPAEAEAWARALSARGCQEEEQAPTLGLSRWSCPPPSPDR